MSFMNRLAASVEQAVIEAVHRRPKDGWASEIKKVVGTLIANNAPEASAQRVASGVVDGITKAANKLDNVRVAVTGTGWVGGGVGSVEEAMISGIRRAQREILLTAYTITTGSSRVVDALERSVATGIRTRILVDKFEAQEPVAQVRLRSLAHQFPRNVMLYDFAALESDGHLHAKVLVVDRQLALVGSANLTFYGMMMAHELAVIIEGPTADLIAGRIDLLIRSLGADALRS
jgi:phosphatidylserine/phosphatidylglycerophosphate/cardiolipin synthase-like enzyme